MDAPNCIVRFGEWLAIGWSRVLGVSGLQMAERLEARRDALAYTWTLRYLQSLNVDDAVRAHRKFSPLDNL